MRRRYARPWSLAARLVAASSLYAAAALGLGACDDDPEPRLYDDVCEPGDPVDGRSCECIGDDCICPSSGDCDIYCVDQCSLQCAGSGNCDFLCEDACDVSCTGSGNCASEVPAGSTVSCTGSGDCASVCHGDCTMECPGSATCTLSCAATAVCELEITNCSGEINACDDGTLVCNGSCS